MHTRLRAPSSIYLYQNLPASQELMSLGRQGISTDTSLRNRCGRVESGYGLARSEVISGQDMKDRTIFKPQVTCPINPAK